MKTTEGNFATQSTQAFTIQKAKKNDNFNLDASYTWHTKKALAKEDNLFQLLDGYFTTGTVVFSSLDKVQTGIEKRLSLATKPHSLASLFTALGTVPICSINHFVPYSSDKTVVVTGEDAHRSVYNARLIDTVMTTQEVVSLSVLVLQNNNDSRICRALAFYDAAGSPSAYVFPYRSDEENITLQQEKFFTWAADTLGEAVQKNIIHAIRGSILYLDRFLNTSSEIVSYLVAAGHIEQVVDYGEKLYVLTESGHAVGCEKIAEQKAEREAWKLEEHAKELEDAARKISEAQTQEQRIALALQSTLPLIASDINSAFVGLQFNLWYNANYDRVEVGFMGNVSTAQLQRHLNKYSLNTFFSGVKTRPELPQVKDVFVYGPVDDLSKDVDFVKANTGINTFFYQELHHA